MKSFSWIILLFFLSSTAFADYLELPITVIHGGSGVSSTTAYSLLAGGTTSTGAFQHVSGLGVSGQVLQSAGSGALPVWANATALGSTARVTNPAGSCTVTASNPSGWITVSSSATGNCAYTITGFSNAPKCVATAEGVSMVRIPAPTSTSFSTLTYDPTTATLQNDNVNIICAP